MITEYPHGEPDGLEAVVGGQQPRDAVVDGEARTQAEDAHTGDQGRHVPDISWCHDIA